MCHVCVPNGYAFIQILHSLLYSEHSKYSIFLALELLCIVFVIVRHVQAAGSAGGAAGAILRVEPGTGALAVGRRLSESDAGEYAVCVQVSDQGHPPLSTRFNFTLVLDGARLDPYAAHSVLTGSHAGVLIRKIYCTVLN